MYITSTLVSDEANSGNQTLSQLLSQAKVLVVRIPKLHDCSAFCSALLRLVSLERDSMVDSVSPGLTIICLHCLMALVHASARRVPFSSKASFCLSLLTPLSRWPESSSLCGEAFGRQQSFVLVPRLKGHNLNIGHSASNEGLVCSSDVEFVRCCFPSSGC